MNIKKVINPGSIEIDGKRAEIFCKVEMTDEKISISGVIGPKRNGDALGSCGQIDMEFKHKETKDDDKRYTNLITPEEIIFNDGWNESKWFDFLSIWKKWHLNDMKASCEHQEALGWMDQASEEVTFYNWSLNSDTISRQNKIKEDAEKTLIETGRAVITKVEQDILKLEYILKTESAELTGSNLFYYVPCKGSYKEHIETKTRGWLNISENEKGLINKPCPECGYKYGTSWKKREIPDEVIKQIEALPVSKNICAWSNY